jgi:hypothetical protein
VIKRRACALSCQCGDCDSDVTRTHVGVLQCACRHGPGTVRASTVIRSLHELGQRKLLIYAWVMYFFHCVQVQAAGNPKIESRQQCCMSSSSFGSKALFYIQADAARAQKGAQRPGRTDTYHIATYASTVSVRSFDS